MFGTFEGQLDAKALNSGVSPTGERLFDNLGLMTLEEVAVALGKAPQTIRNWVAKRQIPHIPGRPVLFRRASIEAWLISKEEQPWR